MQKNLTLTLLAAALLVLASCKKDDAALPEPGKDLDLNANELQKVAADNQFTVKLFKTLAGDNTQPNNIFISPLSVSFAFGMTVNGASGETNTAIRNTMVFNNFTEDQLNTYYNKLITGLPLVDPATTLKVANSIWYDQKFTPLPQFLQVNSAAYNAKVQKVDFTAPSALTGINSWVSQQTNNKIPKIIEGIQPNAVMYLINAVYFKSIWKTKFDANKTSKKTFYTNQGTTVQADFMAGEQNMKAYSDADAGATLYELPYLNDKFSMVIINPNQGKNLQQIIAAMDGAKLNSWISKLQPNGQTVYLPKFKFSFGKKLNGDLINLGMGNAFSDQANFSRINAAGGLTITEVQHKGFVEVNEEGTEAAAATSIGVGYTSAAPSSVMFDKPFLFAIREVKTGLILFIGVMNNPLLAGS